jgi:rare lipoprotein A
VTLPARRLGLLLAALLAAGCVSTPPRPAAPANAPPAPPPSAGPLTPPVPPDQVPDAVPRVEPRSAYGNPAFYDVQGVRYYVLASAVGYRERGVASWYGPGFHEERTSTREPYDMFGMTAAHKTLPLPAYVRVSNLQNGRSIVVRVNDRGPFVGNRIIDLSYTAAAKLDMLRNGTAMVEVEAIDPAHPESRVSAASSPGAAPSHAPLYIQAGAFADPSNAERLADRLRGGGYGSVFVRATDFGGRRLYRVRLGPIADVAEFDRIVAALAQAGVADAHLALD